MGQKQTWDKAIQSPYCSCIVLIVVLTIRFSNDGSCVVIAEVCTTVCTTVCTIDIVPTVVPTIIGTIVPTIVGTHHEARSSSDDGGRVDWVSCRGKVPPRYVNPPRVRVSTGRSAIMVSVGELQSNVSREEQRDL